MKSWYSRALATQLSGGAAPNESAHLIAAMTTLAPEYYYKLSDAASPFANSGSVGGTITGTAVTARGVEGPDGLNYVALEDDNTTTSLLVVPDAAMLSPQASIGLSFAFFHKPTEIDGFDYLVCKSSATVTEREWQVARQADNSVRVIRTNNSTGAVYSGRTSATGVVAAGEWVLISGHISQTGYPALYINGVLAHDITDGLTGTAAAAGPSAVTIGAFAPTSTGNARGQFAHVAFWDRAVSAGEWATLAAAAVTDGWI